MPTRRPSPDHQEAISRRLALLSAELAGQRSSEPGWAVPDLRSGSPAATEPSEPSEPPEPPLRAVPLPGRHAARRGSRGGPAVLDDLVPPTLRGRVAVGPAQLTVVALVVAAGLALTCWWAVRGDAEPVRAPAIEPVADSASALVDVSPVAASGSASPSVTVDVAGKVRRPGIVVLDAGARVVDAIRAAGGARAGVGLGDVNLARLLVDGEQVVVGAQPAPAPVGGTTAGGPSPAAPGAPGTPLVDLNTATQAELETLPEVGPVTAQAILTWRAEHGAFTSVDELLEVDGIGDATLAQLAPYVTV